MGKLNGDCGERQWPTAQICLDLRDLNSAMKHHHYPMPTVDELLSKLAGAKTFSKLDASSGYWQIKVDQASTKLLAFNTSFGVHSEAEG